MSLVGALTAVGIVAVAVLVWLLIRMMNRDKLDAMMKRREGNARVLSRGELVEGRDHIPVAIALCGDSFYYENEDLQAQLDIARLDHVEYADELLTGTSIADGVVLRLRSHGHPVEFILEKGDAERWKRQLPATFERKPAVANEHATATA
jgi:hypothetical protein